MTKLPRVYTELFKYVTTPTNLERIHPLLSYYQCHKNNQDNVWAHRNLGNPGKSNNVIVPSLLSWPCRLHKQSLNTPMLQDQLPVRSRQLLLFLPPGQLAPQLQ